MDSSCQKLYNIHGMDSRAWLEHYFSDKPNQVFADECLKFPMEKLHQVFSTGEITGEHIIDISVGPLLHLIHSACEYFPHIYILRFQEQCIMELNRWLDKRTGAFQWGHAIAYAAALEGKCGQYEDKVMKVKTGITEIIQCDLKKENLTDPVVLPLADCLITAWLLEIISKDKDEFISNLKKFLKLLKPGGNVILIGIINATYYTAGRERLYVLTYDENFLKNVLIGEGFIIDHCDVLNRTSVSDLTDYKAISFTSAHKVILTDGQSPGSGTPESLGIPMPESHTSASQL